MASSSTHLGANGLQVISNGLLDFGPVTNYHDDLTPALIPLEDYPFNQSNYFLSSPDYVYQRKPYLITTIASRSIVDSPPPFLPLDQPNPLLAKRLALTWVNDNQNNTLIPVTGDPNKQLDWPVPQPNKFKPYTWTNNLLENTLAPISGQDPFKNPDFNFIRRRVGLQIDIITRLNEEPPSKPPSEIEYPNPLYKKKSALTWLQARQFFYQDIKPFKQDNYPNPPAARFKVPNTWISSKELDPTATIFMPCSVAEWETPPKKRPMALTWISQIAQLQQIFTLPDSRPFAGPVRLERKPPAISWIQNRPFYYVEPVGIPVSNVDWNLPRRKITFLTFNTQRFTSAISPGIPFNQKDWPNPQRKKRLPEQWEFYYQQDDNLPPVAQLLAIPVVRRRVPNVGWIHNRQITEVVDIPNRLFSYPNPIILKRQTNSWLLNLLQSTLNPGVGETPFNQTDYPNPLRGRRNFHSGWLQEKKFYYTEEPLQPAQYDWPIFRSVKRNHVGFINTQLGVSGPPKFVNVFDVPQRKGIIIPTWIFNSLIDLNSIVGIKPFTQNDWPIIRGRKYPPQDWIYQGKIGLILPNIVGRHICLFAALEEFDLEATIEEFDLEAMITEFRLDAGGTECE